MKKKITMLLKFVIITILWYLLLQFNIFHIGDLLVPSSKDYVEITTPQNNTENETDNREETISSIEQTGHFAANNGTKLENLCNRIEICDKIDFKGNFNDTEKYNYTKTINTIVQFIDENSQENKKIKEVISTIEISKESGNRRWFAKRDSIVFNVGLVKSAKEFGELSCHEMWHITDLWYIQWSSSKKDRNFTEFGKIVFAINDPSLVFYRLSRDKETIRKAEAKKKDFCSGYGMSDPFEDFAECFNMYINHNTLFKEIAKTNSILKKKYNIIAAIFDGQYINANNQDLSLIKTNITRRPRDTTKL